MAATNPVKWSDSKVGYDPGQKQSWKITFKSRNAGKVKVAYVFKASSLGQDSYTYKQRRNEVTLWVGKTSESFKYQLHGNKDSITKKGTFYVNNVADGTTELKVQYENKRVGTNTPWYGPKSTGKFDKAKIGTLKIPANETYTVEYDPGYDSDTVVGCPATKEYYKNQQYNVSSDVLYDTTGHYIFQNGYTTSMSGNVNLASPTIKLFSIQTVYDDITYYACWKPNIYNYRFYTNSSYNIAYPASTTNKSPMVLRYTYGTSAITLPNLNSLCSNNSVKNVYYKEGYKFDGWGANTIDFLVRAMSGASSGIYSCNYAANTNFYPQWKALTSNLIFDYGFDDYKKEISYTYDTLLNFNTATVQKGKSSVTDVTLVRPGYKLIGWVFDKSISQKIYEPSKGPNVNFKPYITDKIKFPEGFTNRQFEDNGLTLYAVWEYYTTLYVYTNNTWKLVLPYVYVNDNGTMKWKMALTYGYVKDQSSPSPSWKL